MNNQLKYETCSETWMAILQLSPLKYCPSKFLDINPYIFNKRKGRKKSGEISWSGCLNRHSCGGNWFEPGDVSVVFGGGPRSQALPLRNKGQNPSIRFDLLIVPLECHILVCYSLTSPSPSISPSALDHYRERIRERQIRIDLDGWPKYSYTTSEISSNRSSGESRGILRIWGQPAILRGQI